MRSSCPRKCQRLSLCKHNTVMAKTYFRKLTLFLLYSIYFTAYGHEDNEPPSEYVRIFRNIPALFEYLLDIIEHRPEILESNDISIVNGDFDEETEPREKRSYGVEIRRKNNDGIESRGSIGHSNLKIVKGTNIAHAVINGYDRSNIAMRSSNGLRITDPVQRGPDEDSILLKNSIDADKIHLSKDIDSNKWAEIGKSFEVGDTLLGFDNLLNLDYQPEDVVAQIIRIDELLEEHNKKNNE